MSKRAKVTANAITRALEKELPPKTFIQRGYGYLKSTLGEWQIGGLAFIGADRYCANDGPGPITTITNGSFSSPLPYATSFAFDKIMYPSTTTTVSYTTMPEGTWIDVAYSETTFWFNNSSTSTIHAHLYELCPRRTLITDDTADTDPSTVGFLNTNASYLPVFNSMAADSMYHIAGGELTETSSGVKNTPGVTLYDNKDITVDWKINYMGEKILEPGENSRFKIRHGRYKFEYGANTGTVKVYDEKVCRFYVLQLYGEPVKALKSAVEATEWSPAKLQWCWVNRTKWQMPMFMQYGAPVTGRDSYTAGTTPLQIISVSPATAGGTPAGVTPGVV